MAKRAWIGNFKGPQGDKGDQGLQGIQGIPGPAGPTGTVDGDTPIEFTEAADLSNIESGESIATIFGKTKKILGSILIGAGSTLLGQNLKAARALVSDVNGKVGVSTITVEELGHLAGLTKNAQEQFNELTENIERKIDDVQVASNLSSISKSGFYWANSATAGKPTTDVVGACFALISGGIFGAEIFIDITGNRLYFRSLNNGVWKDWKQAT